ncbi:MAG TPA: NAD(P)/FAD-dependent oxidoreductase [Candidatus Binatia bacterium]|jgi:predicted Rossmann fold flavoprotein|nr:NAD(P)/FAD-dependent oxidoreductase [Candidatus Binatia bacterium]
MSQRRIVVVGGGAAGFFAAITCAEASPEVKITLFEKSAQFLSKVRISGGGRCNVTHACFEPRELSDYYPRGGQELLAAFQIFQPRHTIAWFEARGVKLKTESDGRMFPVTDSSKTIIDCLLGAAKRAGVELLTNRAPERVTRHAQDGFEFGFAHGEALRCDCLLLATGGCRVPAAGRLAVSLGHTLEPPVPSLFTFHIAAPWLRELAGISVQAMEVSLPGLGRRDTGAVLITHAGLSGPAILRLSAWCARDLHALNYQAPLRLNWLPHLDAQTLAGKLDALRTAQPARLVVNTPIAPLAVRLWQNLALAAGISRETRWAELSRSARHRLVQQLSLTELQVIGKTLNQEEFVTCGGVRLSEVNFKTMESRICPGLYFAGELLDIDGLTGGFNFQSAWTTGWLAGKAMTGRPVTVSS